MITENGLLLAKKSKQPFEVKPKKDSLKNCILAFQNQKNDTLRHSIPYCYLLRNIVCYFSFHSKRQRDAFFQSKKNSKWYLVAFGMIGTALSGVTFISVPGEVGAASGEQFKYFQFVLGNAMGFIFIAKVLLLYYRMNLTSIYGYIERRLGPILIMLLRFS
jgi:Na+/proline symporter